MFVCDKIIKELDDILSMSSDFERDGFFQSSGKTDYVGISQSQLNDNIFSFNYHNQSILHFTDLNSALLILHSKAFRARSLESISDDPNELIHCLKLLDQENEAIKSEKEYNFIACFTPLEEKINIKDLEFHWKEYGNNHKGVAFEFEIIRRPLYPFHYSLNINYLDSIDEQHNLLNYLKDKVTDIVILKALIPFFACIKQKKFDSEKEVRLFAQYDKSITEKNHYENNIGFTISKENKVRFHYDIPFCFHTEESNDKLLRLKKIHIGRKIEENDGQMIVLNHLIPLLDKNGIEYKWIN